MAAPPHAARTKHTRGKCPVRFVFAAQVVRNVTIDVPAIWGRKRPENVKNVFTFVHFCARPELSRLRQRRGVPALAGGSSSPFGLSQASMSASGSGWASGSGGANFSFSASGPYSALDGDWYHTAALG